MRNIHMPGSNSFLHYDIPIAIFSSEDANKLAASSLKPKGLDLLSILAIKPFQNPAPFERLVSDLTGAYFKESTVRVLRIWTHYE